MTNANLFRRHDYAHGVMLRGALCNLQPPAPKLQPALRARLVEHVVVARRGNLRLVKAVANG